MFNLQKIAFTLFMILPLTSMAIDSYVNIHSKVEPDYPRHAFDLTVLETNLDNPRDFSQYSGAFSIDKNSALPSIKKGNNYKRIQLISYFSDHAKGEVKWIWIDNEGCDDLSAIRQGAKIAFFELFVYDADHGYCSVRWE